MISRRLAILAALGVAIYPALPALPASAPDLLAGLDTDHDGPHAVYALVQTALVQDEALKRANGRIEELQAAQDLLRHAVDPVQIFNHHRHRRQPAARLQKLLQ